MSFAGIYDSANLGRLRNKSNSDIIRTNLYDDIAKEERDFKSAVASRESSSGLGRLLGGGLGMGISALLAPVTGPMSLLAQSLIQAAIHGATSYGGQQLATGGGNIDSGKFLIDDVRDSNKDYDTGTIANAGKDALTAGLLKYSKIPLKDTDAVPDNGNYGWDYDISYPYWLGL